MTSNLGFPLVFLVVMDVIFTLREASVFNCGITLAVIMHIGIVSRAYSKFGIFRWNCMFCGKPGHGSLLKMLTDICNHGDN